MKTEEIDPEEGDACPCGDCDGVMDIRPVEGCSCHIAPPCNACVENPIVCMVCGWTYGDEVRVAETIKASLASLDGGYQKLDSSYYGVEIANAWPDANSEWSQDPVEQQEQEQLPHSDKVLLGGVVSAWCLAAMLIVFATLKLMGVVTWSWWWVTAPIWVPTLIAVLALYCLLFILSVVLRK